MEKEIIKLENVWKIYGNEVKVFALKDISFKINKGDFISIMGPSGSGKSTLLHLIGLLDKPSKGKIYFEGEEVSKLSDNELAEIRNKKIGFVFQFFNLIPTLNALENVELPMIFAGVSKKERIERAKNLLEMVGLKDRIYHYPNQLSGGQQQRVAIARALANNPKLILADEPTGNLDSKSGKEIVELFKMLNKKGKTIVIVTHDPVIAKETKKIIKIKDGVLYD